MDWVGPRKAPPVEAISYQGEPCNSLDQLWNALHSTFNSAMDRPVDLTILGDQWESPTIRTWTPFVYAEMTDALQGCSNRSAPGPDHISWRHLKQIIQDGHALTLFVWLANACLLSGHWPKEFKQSTTVILPKPGKPSYDTPKSFRPIVLLNTLGKLFEKMLSTRLQFEAAKFGVLHPNQFGGVRQNSTKDAGCFLTHVVRAGWRANLKTSVVAFNLAQFFPSVNHDILLGILEKQGFPTKVVEFFKSYLTERSTKYSWDGDLSPAFETEW